MKKKNIIPILITILSIIIIIITIKVVTKQELLIDNIAYNLLVVKARNKYLTPFMKLMTELSNTKTIIAIAVLLTLIIKNKRISLTIPANLIYIAFINQVLKFIFHRPRPVGYRLINIGGYSFPSGHAMASTAFYGLLIYLSYRYIKNKNIKYISMSLNLFIIVFIIISRVYLGVHYFSDVLVGASISIIYLIIYIKLLNKYKILPKSQNKP